MLCFKAFKEYLCAREHTLLGDAMNQIFNTTDSLLTAHRQFKLDLESCMLAWETSPSEDRITKPVDVDDVIIDHIQRLKVGRFSAVVFVVVSRL